MKLALQAENPLEWIFLQVASKANLIPMPQVHGLCDGIFSKVTLTASRLGIFEAAKDSPQTLEEMAQKTKLNSKALSAIMPILIQLEYFKYKKAILLKDLSEETFENLFKDGLIGLEFRMHIKENGSVRDHGPGFRISRNHINKLYAENKVIFDGSKVSEEQK